MITRRERKREREEGKEWERFGYSNNTENRCEMRGCEHSFILGRGERPLLDELQVSHIQ
jgi:hypothetical protein